MADRIYSKESGIAPFETFFHDLDIQALSFFNYWTQDETRNDWTTIENRSLSDVPRFVKIIWNRTPDLAQREIDRKKVESPSMVRSDVRKQHSDFVVGGVSYSPDQIRPKDFASVVSSLANSDIAPGVLAAVVSMPMNSSGIRVHPRSAFEIDLDAWFSSPNSKGISVAELENAIRNRTSGYFSLDEIYKFLSQGNLTDSSYQMFAGQFSVVFQSFANDRSSINSVNPSSPATSISTRAAESNRILPTVPLKDIFKEVATTPPPSRDSNSVSVNFVDTGIGSTTVRERVNAAIDPIHGGSIAAISQVIKNLIAYADSGLASVQRRVDIKSFDCPVGVPEREYVGYIVEKYEQVDGVLVFKDVIGIPDMYVNEYYDTKVRYGGVYRYRVRSIFRWVRPKSTGPTGYSTTERSNMIQDGQSNISQLSLTPNFASYFGGQWSKDWATAHVIDVDPPSPPDQLWLLPKSGKRKIVISFALPGNEQRDIYRMSLYRKVLDIGGNVVSDWVEISTFDMSRPGYFEDGDVGLWPETPYRYVYAATSWSVHNGESPLSEQLIARLNDRWQDKGELPVEHYSCAGVNRLLDQGAFSVNPTRVYKTHLVATPVYDSTGRYPARITLSGQMRLGNRLLTGRNYLLRLHSLDTGETTDVDFDISIQDQPSEVIDGVSDVYVPSANEKILLDTRALTSRPTFG